MATYPKPSAKQIREAFKDHRVDFTVHPRERSRDQWASGLRAATVHHTAGVNSVNYLATQWNLPGANVCITNGRYNPTDGVAYVLAWGSCWHSGAGGPWSGVAARDSLHLVSWGIEIESKGTKKDITDAQVETTGRMLAALIDLGMPKRNVHRHADWTDGTGPVGGFPLPTRGRKNDTNASLGYTTEFWKTKAGLYVAGTWDGVVPSQANVKDRVPKALWRLQCRLFDLAYRKDKPVKPENGPAYPSRSMARFREAQGWTGDGFGDASQRRLFGEVR